MVFGKWRPSSGGKSVTRRPTQKTDIPLLDGDRPLIVSDVDEVALNFLDPFNAFLQENGYKLVPRSFRLTGNVVSIAGGNAAPSRTVSTLMDGFFAAQQKWQTPTIGVVESLARLSTVADIVFLSAMPPKYFAARRALLDEFGLHYPLVASESSKGELIRRIHADSEHHVILIDDMIYNLHSVKKHIPHSMAINFMANDTFRAMAPDPGEDVHLASNWTDVTRLILRHISS